MSGGLFAGSLKLINDSPFKLRVEIWGNDDSKIGELVIEKNTFQYWSDVFGEQGYQGSFSDINKNYSKSRTPYRVAWFCMNGKEYSTCGQSFTEGGGVVTSGEVTARTCLGTQVCN